MMARIDQPRKNRAEIKRKRHHFKVIFRQVKQNNYLISPNNTWNGMFKLSSQHINSKNNQKKMQGVKSLNSSFYAENLNEQRHGQYCHSKPSLFSQLQQIEKINNSKKINKIPRKSVQDLNRQYIDSRWQNFIRKQKISTSTYQNIKRLNKNRQQLLENKVQIFGNLNKLNQNKIQVISKQKTTELCNFMLGFPDSSMKCEKQQYLKSTNLGLFRQKVLKSQSLSRIYKKLAKSKHIQSMKEQTLKDNFISAVYANQYINKNGKSSQKSKKVLKMANCVL